MNRYCLVLLFLISSIGQSLSAQPIRSSLPQIPTQMLLRMPMFALPTLPVEQRKDLLDFYEAGKNGVLRDMAGNTVYIDSMADSTMTVRIGNDLHIQLVAHRKDSIQVWSNMITTVGDSVRSSRCVFFDDKGAIIDQSKVIPTNLFGHLQKKDELSERFNQIRWNDAQKRLIIRPSDQPNDSILLQWNEQFARFTKD